MALPKLPVTCQYRGIVQVAIRTYTTAYPFIKAGWDFNPNSLEPMEFISYCNDASITAIMKGFKGQIIDLANGYTSFAVGAVTAFINATLFDNPTWQNNKITGWAYGHGLTHNFSVYEYPLFVGHNMSFSSLGFRTGVLLANPNNTGAPASDGAGGNFPVVGGGIYSSAYDNLVNKNFVYNGATIIETDASAYGWGAGLHADYGTVYKGTNYITVHDPSGVDPTLRLLQTDFGVSGTLYQVRFQNPPGGLDINTNMQNRTPSSGSITTAGYLQIFNDVVNVENKTLNGYGVICSPDMAEYRIIQFLPQDATAAGWNAQIGTFTGKLDTQNALWMKNVNSNNTLFVSAGSVIKQLPIFPPVPLPSPEIERDPVPRLIRSM